MTGNPMPLPPRSNRMFWTGTLGAVLAAVCCFTPALTLTLAALGLTLAWLDYVLLPLLLGCMALALISWIRYRKSPCPP